MPLQLQWETKSCENTKDDLRGKLEVPNELEAEESHLQLKGRLYFSSKPIVSFQPSCPIRLFTNLP